MTTYDGLSADALGTVVRSPRCLVFDSVTSTLDVVHEIAAEGAPAASLVVADQQVAGRGRQGRRWHSPPGTGVWLGYLSRPERGGERGVTALRVGLALTESMAAIGVQASIKWPNDVVVWDRKAGGILCEGRWSRDQLRWMAIGIGVNVHGPMPQELAASAIALDEVQPSVTRVDLLEQLVPRLHDLPDLPELTETELRTFRMHDWLADRAIGAPVSGRARGIDAEGAFLIETGTGVERILGGSIVPA